MRVEYWEETNVCGWRRNENGKLKYGADEKVLHRRGQDPVVLACRRNRELAGCEHIAITTTEAFAVQLKDNAEIDREIEREKREDRQRGREWDYVGGGRFDAPAQEWRSRFGPARKSGRAG